MINAELLCLFLLLYIYIIKLIVDYLKKKSLKFSNKKIEKIVLFIQSRYIMVWSNYQKIFNIIAILLLSSCVIVSKIAIFLVLNA